MHFYTLRGAAAKNTTEKESVLQLVRALHRTCRAAGSIPVRGPMDMLAFFASAPGYV